jgi:hypothetical protein
VLDAQIDADATRDRASPTAPVLDQRSPHQWRG